MKFIYNNKIFRDRRRDLRHKQTKVEMILWWRIRNKQISDFKFFRQYSVGPYVLDFYCPDKRLAIELDGEKHMANEQHLYDKDRTKYLNGNNIQVLRFWNSEVENDIDSVITKIAKIAYKN